MSRSLGRRVTHGPCEGHGEMIMLGGTLGGSDMGDGNNLNTPVVGSGKYAGMGACDLALLEALLIGAETKYYDLMQDGKPPREW